MGLRKDRLERRVAVAILNVLPNLAVRQGVGVPDRPLGESLQIHLFASRI